MQVLQTKEPEERDTVRSAQDGVESFKAATYPHPPLMHQETVRRQI